MTDFGWLLTGVVWLAAPALVCLEAAGAISHADAAIGLLCALIGQTVAAASAGPLPIRRR